MTSVRVPTADAIPAGRRQLPSGVAMVGTAVAFMSLYLGAGALTPLLVTYEQAFDFTPAMLTAAFAVYAIGFLVAALTLGALSDHVGRRPVLIAALIVQLVSNTLFLVGTDVEWVIAGRIVQGVASGAATSAFTAAIVEFAPNGRKRLGTILAGISLTGGLALGSLLAGLAIQLTSAANTIIFTVLIVLTTLGGITVFASGETVTRSPGAVRSLIPRISVPAAARREFYSSAPVVAAVWMLAGLSGGLAPNIVRSVFHLESAFVGGFAGFIAPAVATAVGLLFAAVPSPTAMSIGIFTSVLGAGAIIGGILAPSLALMIAGQAIAGVGFGSAFTAALQLLIPQVAPGGRAAVVAAVYVVAYTAFGVPIVVEGQLVAPLGEIPAVVGYTVLTILLALVSLVARTRLARRGRTPRP
ncbi:MFS transporter [Pseudonocardia benzenivorans]|uniref:MFS transporter n=1 Tax=Pseudonocardia benzenivorans TaxID=228005 RepID=A0ABW3VEM9_9PSEU